MRTWRVLGAVSLWLMVVCSAKADRAGWPEFSWETVPVCLHFGKHGAALSDKELAFVARTSNLVCLEKGHAKGRLGSTEKGIAHDAKRLKALNPDVKVLYYWNGVLNYNLYEACKEVRKNPQWVLRDENGKPIFKDEKARLEQYNLLDPGFRRWWVAETGRAVREFGCDGVFMDALPQVKTRVLRQMGGGEKTEEKLVAAVEEMMTGAQKAMGKEGFLLYNGLRYLPRDKETGGKEFLPFGDGAMVEHFTAFGSRSKEAIVSDMESIVQAGRAGKMLVVKGWPDVDFNWMNGEKMREPYAELAKEAEEKMTFSLACFLVAAQEHSYFCYSWGYREVHGSLVDYGQFQKPLGKPKGDAVREGWTFRRSFENAEVWVDVEKRKATIKWGKK